MAIERQTVDKHVDPPVNLKEQILEIARSHAETARAAYGSRDREVQLLQATNANLRTAAADLHAEVVSLKGTIARLTEQRDTVLRALELATAGRYGAARLVLATVQP